MHSYVLVSTVAADGLVLKHQVISSHSTDSAFTVPNLYDEKWLLLLKNSELLKSMWRNDSFT